MATTTFTVGGMTCGGCVKRVRSALSDVEGVTGVDVTFKGGLVTVTSDRVLDDSTITAVITDAGYELTSQTTPAA